MRFTTRMATGLCLVLVLVAGTALGAQGSLLRRGGVDADQGHRFKLDVGVGWAGLDELESDRPALELTPRLDVRRSATTSLAVTVPVFVVPGSYDVVGVAPGVELTWRTGCCWRPSVFAGGGLWYEGGRTFEVSDLGLLRSEGGTRPLLTLGLALRRPLSARTSLRLEARALTTFAETTTLRAADGSGVAELDRGTRTSVLLTVGLGFDF